MGEVYRARDTRLKRDVAIKVLPDAFTSDVERVSRLQREAEALASLNHPNIAAIHQLDESDGSRFLVLELVEGDTLADRIALGALSVSDALKIALQITAALQAAHEQSIVHRDLKPANIKVTPSDVVKVLDFGLAKIHEPATEAALTQSPTILGRTQANVILGTAAYMSPEQARGQAVDRGSDIWSFGCVFYEMLTGKQAFTGETITDILGGIVRVDPDWSALPDTTPTSIRSLLRRCLQKDRRRRLKDIADASLEIEDALAVEAAQPAATMTPRPHEVASRSRNRRAWVVAGLLLLVAAVTAPFAVVHLRETQPDERAIRFDVILPDKVTLTGAPPAISPDGRRLVFVASLAGKTQLWIRPIDSTAAQPLAGTDGADYPFWSPDSRSIAFFAGGKLRKIDASGGPSQTLSDAPSARGGAWNQDDVIVFAPATLGPLHRVAAAGGTSTPLTTLDASSGENSHRSPSFLPDGRRFLFMVQGTEDKQGIYVASLDDARHTLLLRTTSSGAYAAPGYLLFLREVTLMAQRIDIESLALTGQAFPIAEQVGAQNINSSTFSVSDNGVLAHSGGLGGLGADRQLSWFDRAGKREPVGAPAAIADVVLSPDNRRAAVQSQGGNQDIWVVDLMRGGLPSRLTFDASVEDYPVWSPDGNRILYTSTKGGGQNMYSKLSSGTGGEEVVLKSATVKRPTDWSSRFVLYEEDDPKSQADLWALPLFGDKKPMLVLGSQFSEQQGRLSPDGKWIAYVSNETGPPEVYVQSFPPSGGKWQLSTAGGVTPRWRGNGRELFYLALDFKIMSVAVRTSGATFDHGSPTALFETSVTAVNTIATNRYDVSADGQRFLVNASIENAGSAPITVVVNWLANLKADK
jgi:Tol biopolymer transport system component